jgi:hypothetical protein
MADEPTKRGPIRRALTNRKFVVSACFLVGGATAALAVVASSAGRTVAPPAPVNMPASVVQSTQQALPTELLTTTPAAPGTTPKVMPATPPQVVTVTRSAGTVTVTVERPVETVTVTSTATVTTSKVPTGCQESDDCWNECTMGNQGPCTVDAFLPNGARFKLEAFNRYMGEGCGANESQWMVTVTAVTPAGARVGGEASATPCVIDGGDPSTDKTVMEPLFRKVAATL